MALFDEMDPRLMGGPGGVPMPPMGQVPQPPGMTPAPPMGMPPGAPPPMMGAQPMMPPVESNVPPPPVPPPPAAPTSPVLPMAPMSDVIPSQTGSFGSPFTSLGQLAPEKKPFGGY